MLEKGPNDGNTLSMHVCIKKIKERKKRGLEEVPPETAEKKIEEMLQEIVQQLRSKKWKIKKIKKKKTRPWTLKVALRPSDVITCALPHVW